MAEWLNTLVHGLAIAVVAWAAARPRLFDAAWRGRIWGAALVGVAALTAMTAIGDELARLLSARGLALAGAFVSGPSGEVGAGHGASWIAGHGGPWIAGHGGPALLTVPAVRIPLSLLVSVWAAVALGRLLFLAVAIVRVRAARAASRPFPAWRCEQLPRWTAANRRRFAIVVSDRVAVPSMLGFGRPMIAVPADWQHRLADEALDAVLVHEVAHAERRDDLFALAQQLVVAACWFHPAAWWITRRIAFEREAACDERAARLTTTRRYARSLVAVAEAMRETQAAPPVLVASSAVHRGQLSRRIETLLAVDARPRLVRSSWVAAPAVALMLALAAAVPLLPTLFDVGDRAERLVAAEQEVGPRQPMEAGEIDRQAETRRPQPDVQARRAAVVVEAPLAEGAATTANVQAGATASPVVPDASLSSRELNAHVMPSALPTAGVQQDNLERAAGASAPFRTLGSAFSRAGAGTGRWFSRAGTSVASAVTSK